MSRRSVSAEAEPYYDLAVARYPGSNVSYTIGPGGISPAVKILVISNIALFLINLIVGDAMTLRLGLSPKAVFEQFALWQPLTYMFLHSTGGLGHILFNMLALWMFGTDLERTWGTRFFTKYYFVTGVGAAATSLLLSMWIDGIYYSVTVGASGAIYGLLLAYALYFPHRTIFLIIFPLPARVFVIIAGALAFMNSIGGAGHQCRAHGAPWRTRGRVSLLEGPAHPAARRIEVSLPALEDGPRPQPFRRLLGRPLTQ